MYTICSVYTIKKWHGCRSSTCTRGRTVSHSPEFCLGWALGVSSGTVREQTWWYDRFVFTLPTALASFLPSPALKHKKKILSICMLYIYYRNKENTDLALALEPLVVLLQAPQEVQGQLLPAHTHDMYTVDEITAADTTSVTRAVRESSCTHLSDGLQLC